jgi:hypothetical protein
MKIRRILPFWAGLALIIAGVAGVAFSIGGLVVLPRLEREVETVSAEQLDVLDRALSTTLEGLITAEAALVQAAEAVDSLEGIMGGVGLAINDTAPILDVAAELLGEQLPATIQSTQETLTSVATSAQLVDDILGVISVIPLLGTDRYNPDVSLHQGFQDVADGLDGIPEMLLAAGEDLSAGAGNLDEIEEGFAAMGQGIRETMTSLESAQAVLQDYQTIVGDLQGTLSSARESLPGWLRALRWGLTLGLVWFGIAQIGLLTQGWELLGRRSVSSTAVHQGAEDA